MFMSTSCIRGLGRLPIIMAMAVSEAMGLDSEQSRILFHFIILIVLFHEGMLRMFLAPVLQGRDMRFEAIGGGASESQRKVLTHLVRYFSYVFGIPWAPRHQVVSPS